MHIVRWLGVLLAFLVVCVQGQPGAYADSGAVIKLTFLGTGAPRPSLSRYGPAILVEAGDYKIMVDAGPGMRERLFQAGGFEMLTAVDHILVTHLHF